MFTKVWLFLMIFFGRYVFENVEVLSTPDDPEHVAVIVFHNLENYDCHIEKIEE